MSRTMAQSDGGDRYATLDLDEFERSRPQVAVMPAPTLFSVAADVAGARAGVAPDWISAARAELEPVDLEALAPIGIPPGEYSPGRVTFTDVDEPTAIPEALERMATMPTEPLLDDIDFAFSSEIPPRWHPVARRPRVWLIRYARALGRVWRGIRGPWAAAAPLFDREIERVETAAAGGALNELMTSVHYDAHVRDGKWRLADPDLDELHLPDGGLSMRPVLAGPGSARVTLHTDGLMSSVSYPLPGALRVLSGDVLPPAAALGSLLGQQRAKILRLLDAPRSAGQLARAIIASPSAATHHMRALEGAGLIVRERSGRNVIVHRTARGTGLLALYDEI